MNIDLIDEVYQLVEMKPDAFEVIGQGERKLLILALKENSHESDLTTIKKLVSAIKHDFDKDVFFIWLAPKDQFSISALNLAYDKLLLFGVKPENIGLNINYHPYTIINMEDMSLIVTESILQLNANQKAKSTLWEKLQILFL